MIPSARSPDFRQGFVREGKPDRAPAGPAEPCEVPTSRTFVRLVHGGSDAGAPSRGFGARELRPGAARLRRSPVQPVAPLAHLRDVSGGVNSAAQGIPPDDEAGGRERDGLALVRLHRHPRAASERGRRQRLADGLRASVRGMAFAATAAEALRPAEPEDEGEQRSRGRHLQAEIDEAVKSPDHRHRQGAGGYDKISPSLRTPTMSRHTSTASAA